MGADDENVDDALGAADQAYGPDASDSDLNGLVSDMQSVFENAGVTVAVETITQGPAAFMETPAPTDSPEIPATPSPTDTESPSPTNSSPAPSDTPATPSPTFVPTSPPEGDNDGAWTTRNSLVRCGVLALLIHIVY